MAKCISPIRIKQKNKRLAATVPFMDVPCGQCGNCLQKKANAWTFRLSIEEKNSESAFFITLTYTDEKLYEQTGGVFEEYPSVEKRDLQLFIKKLRFFQSKNYPKRKKIKYYAIGEYGDKFGRPHYHVIAFNIDKLVVEKIDRIWNNGIVHVGSTTRQSINYVTYYIFKKMENKKLNAELGRKNEFAIMSKELGIGYMVNKKYHRDNKTFIAISNGQLTSLPLYYRKKFFSRSERLNIANSYAEMSEKQFQKEIEKLKRLNHKNPELEIETNNFVSQQKKLERISKDKF